MLNMNITHSHSQILFSNSFCRCNLFFSSNLWLKLSGNRQVYFGIQSTKTHHIVFLQYLHCTWRLHHPQIDRLILGSWGILLKDLRSIATKKIKCILTFIWSESIILYMCSMFKIAFDYNCSCKTPPLPDYILCAINRSLPEWQSTDTISKWL